MDTFKGNWRDQNNTQITVAETANQLTVKYAGGRGPFTGFEVDLTSPVICVNFTDDAAYVGALSNDGKTIYWNNATEWTRI